MPNGELNPRYMQAVTRELSNILSEYCPKFAAITNEVFSEKPLPHKWSKKEVLGHLIDSAQNNLRRFICAQYESHPPFSNTRISSFITSSAGHPTKVGVISMVTSPLATETREITPRSTKDKTGISGSFTSSSHCITVSSRTCSIDLLVQGYIILNERGIIWFTWCFKCLT